MKAKYFSLLMAFSTFSTVSSAQISVKQADKIVQEYIEKEITDYYWLYSNENLEASKSGVTAVLCWSKESISINNPSFVYFIDEHPYANWEHPCRYLFINKNNGQISEKKHKIPPANLETWKMITPVPEIKEEKKFDFSKSTINLRSGINTQNCYAVILSGGMDMSYNYERYWNDCSAIYSTLVNVYGYLKNNIYVLMSDGTNPANDRNLINGGYDSSPLDLNGDGVSDIQYAATKNNIKSVFNILSNILTPNDYLFIFTTDHGGTTSSGEATLNLWNETITASEFAVEINKVNAGQINIVMEQCYSGGFIPYLAKQGRVIATACSSTQLSYAMSSLVYNEFVYYWTAAAARFTPSGSSVNADSNNDGYISVKEAFDYAKMNDTKPEAPQYNSTKNHLGNYLTLRGTQACTTVNFFNQSVNTNQTITNCKINLQNVTVQNNAKLVLDAIEGITINGNFVIQVGSQLEIR